MNTSCLFSRRTVLGVALLLAALPLRAADTVKYVGQPGSEVKIDGTSNIHDWTVKSQIIRGGMEVTPEFEKDLKAVSPAPKVEVAIPVRTLKSGNGKMDEVMQDHMNYKQFKEITYQLTSLTPKGDPKTPNGPAEYTATGELTVSGAKKTLEMPVTIERLDGGKLKVKGSAPIKMTDHKIKPPQPALAMGLIKTGDDVKVSFEWVLAKPADTAGK